MIILLCMLSWALAEPPVGDYYKSSVSGYEQTPHQQYLPPDLTVPSARTSKSFNGLSNQYLLPRFRDILQEYGPPNTRQRQSQKYGLPPSDTLTLRSGLPHDYSTTIGRSSQHKSRNSDLGQSLPSASLKTDTSQRYGLPSFRNSPSSLYGSPLKSSLSAQYGTPQFPSTVEKASLAMNSVPGFRGTKSHFRSVAQEYGTPMNLDGLSFLSQNSGNPSRASGLPARALSTQYGTPSTRSSVTSFEEPPGPLKNVYGVPFGRSLDQDIGTYGTPDFGRSHSNTNAFASSYDSRRTTSLTYGEPSSRSTVPLQEYGVPEGSIDQGYEYARNALELLNQEPANYNFAYKVSDDDSGSDFGHSETRKLDRTEGAYFVLLPDGTKQVVEYEADEDGFKPRISVEQVDSPTALAAEGPY